VGSGIVQNSMSVRHTSHNSLECNPQVRRFGLTDIMVALRVRIETRFQASLYYLGGS
jgi:hypothetical protein